MTHTLVHKLQHWADTVPERPALHGPQGDGWRTLTWSEYWLAVRQTAKGLISLGLQPGECVALVGANRPEWVICQLGIIAAGGIPAPSYATNTVEQVAHILRNSQARIAIADTRALVQPYRRAVESDPALTVEHLIVTLPGEEESDTRSLESLRAAGAEQPDEELDRRLAAMGPDDTCMLIYTSGTTGVSKGVMLDHGGIVAMSGALRGHAPELVDQGDQYKIVSYLPLCHVAEQMLTNFMTLETGGQVYFCPELSGVKDALVAVRPTVFAAVPRVWEKFQGALEARFAEASGLKAMLLSWARRTELAAVQQELQTGRPAPSVLRTLAHRLVLSKVHQGLGLDQLVMASTAAAPISRSTLDFFASLGIVIHEFYGMSETSGVVTGNALGRARLGTVGDAVTGVEIRIADDGEILARGRNMTRGYLRMPEETAELIDADGWLHTGDLGALDEAGYLTITGRKKDILITAGGKNVAPAEMEGLMQAIEGVGQAVVVGDRMPYLCALIALDPENTAKLAHAAGVTPSDLATLAADPKVATWLQSQVEEHCNQHVARYQTIKRIMVVPGEFTVDGGELTPTMKIRRAEVTRKYADLIETMYGGALV